MSTPANFFTEIEKLILKIIWNCKEPRIHKTVFFKKQKDSHFLISKLTTKKSTRGAGTRVDT